MAIRVRGRRRSLSKKVSSFNMYDDQVYQIRAIMESTGEYKDAPVIRQLLDEALRARRLKALGYADDAGQVAFVQRSSSVVEERRHSFDRAQCSVGNSRAAKAG